MLSLLFISAQELNEESGELCQWQRGGMSQPTIGEFQDGRGEFFDEETLNGRAILVRFVISGITPNSCRFEQASSDDGGKIWEVNWIATDTRIKEESDNAHSKWEGP